MITMPTADTVRRLFLKRQIMLPRHRAALQCQIIVFIDQANIKPCRTWVAMFAVYTFPHGFVWRHGADGRIIPFLIRPVEVGQDFF